MVLVGIVFVVTIISYQYFHSFHVKYMSVTSFKACVEGGFKVTTSYPEKCVMPGKSFINPFQKEVVITTIATTTVLIDYKNLEYTIGNQRVLFVDGKSSIHTGSSFYEIINKPLIYDINSDNKEDVVFLLKMLKDGDFKEVYYIASAIALNNGYIGSNTLYVDIDVLSSAFFYKNGEIVLGYTTKVAATTLKEKHFTFTGDILQQISYK